MKPSEFINEKEIERFYQPEDDSINLTIEKKYLKHLDKRFIDRNSIIKKILKFTPTTNKKKNDMLREQILTLLGFFTE